MCQIYIYISIYWRHCYYSICKWSLPCNRSNIESITALKIIKICPISKIILPKIVITLSITKWNAPYCHSNIFIHSWSKINIIRRNNCKISKLINIPIWIPTWLLIICNNNHFSICLFTYTSKIPFFDIICIIGSIDIARIWINWIFHSKCIISIVRVKSTNK